MMQTLACICSTVCVWGVQNEVESDTLTSESVWLTEKFILGNKNGPEINK